jgi:hypothetical protein
MNVLLHVIYKRETAQIYIVDTNEIQDQEVLDLIHNAEDDEHYGLEINDPSEIITKYLYNNNFSAIYVNPPCHIEKIITVWS